MTGYSKPLYSPALRMKTGELHGIRDLATDVADCILPRMIVPPLSERDDSLQLRLLDIETVPDVSVALSAHWLCRDVLVEATHLISEMGTDKLGNWFPKMFERARMSRVQAIPLVQLKDFLPSNIDAYMAAIERTAHLQFGLVISSGDLGDGAALTRAMEVLRLMGLAAEQCLVIADFHDADLSDPGIVAPIIGAALESLQLIAPWQSVIFQGTNFPEKNPAEPDLHFEVQRNEWHAWRKAVDFDPQTAEHLVFGDYAADCGKLVFGGSGGAAIRHYRYTTPNSWLIQRGSKNGKDKEIMRSVCQNILSSGHFAGQAFSKADDFIYRTAHGHAGPGNSTDWRAINTTHHLTRVVHDLGGVRGRRFVKRAVEPTPEQVDLFS